MKYFSQYALALIDENTIVWITFQMKEALQIDGNDQWRNRYYDFDIRRFRVNEVEMLGRTVEGKN